MIKYFYLYFILLSSLISQIIGIHTHISRDVDWDPEYENRHQIIEKIKKNNINLVRIEINWREVEKNKGRFNWSVIDSTISLLKLNDINAMVVLHGIPNWANPISNNLDHWYNFVENVFYKYDNYIYLWEIWNEPNLNKFWPQDEEDSIFVNLFKNTSNILNRNPSNTIILGGISSSIRTNNFQYWEKLFNMNLLNYVDAVGIHPYDYRDLKLINYFNQLNILIKRYSNKIIPIYVTEFGRSIHNINESVQAKTIIRTLLVYWLLKGEKFIVFEFMDDQIFQKKTKYGINTNKLDSRLSFQAVAEINELISNSKIIEYEIINESIYIKYLKRDGKIGYIFWGHQNNKNTYSNKFNLNLDNLNEHVFFNHNNIIFIYE